jgi:hypothetical protein
MKNKKVPQQKAAQPKRLTRSSTQHQDNVEYKYTDRLYDPPSRVPVKPNNHNEIVFPKRLHEMLSTEMTLSTDEKPVVYWQSHGRSFLVADSAAFVDHVLPR